MTISSPSLLVVLLFWQSPAVIISMSSSQSQFYYDNRILPFDGVGVTSVVSVPLLPSSYSSSPFSLQTDSNEYDQYYVGTKRGRVLQVAIPPPLPSSSTVWGSDSLSSLVQIHDVRTDDDKFDDETTSRGDVKVKRAVSNQYPIFSLMCVAWDDGCNDNYNSHDLLAGGADRYVTVWRRRRIQNNREGESELYNRGSWLVEEQLGPHTGWVKDVAKSIIRQFTRDVDDEIDRVYLFSIGCNCIEVWSRNTGGKYQHIHKLKIESSVQLGSTLSSDILCLATTSISVRNNSIGDNYDNDRTKDGTINLLLAGGVDGRIHLWTVTSKQIATLRGDSTPIFGYSESIPAHHGRVTTMVICPSNNILITAGNDSSIHCRLITTIGNNFNLLLSEWKATILNLAVGDEGVIVAVKDDTNTASSSVKITSLCIVDETARRSTIAIGTSCGKLALIDIVLLEVGGNAQIISVVRDTMKLNAKADENGKEDDEVVIHALCAGTRYENNAQRILVGHSRGLTFWDLSIDAST